MKVNEILQQVRVHNYPNISDRKYLHERSRNMPKQMIQRGCSGSAIRNYTGEKQAVQAKSFNACNSRLLNNYRLPAG
ncbi:MAG: hypothetical protein Q7U51_16060 [Methanoregula sp.]|nr:hypothetical protein [Methanoregula sp.]